MTDFSDIKAGVQLITNRPDKAALEANKINGAIRMISLSGEYWRDLQEVTLGSAEGVVASAYVQSLTLPARLRKTVYVAYPDTANKPHINGKSIDEIVIKGGADLNDIYYMSNTLLHIRHTELTSQFLFGYYEYPALLSLDTDTNWILDLMPELVIDLASTLTLNSIGNRENANLVQALASGELALMVQDAIASHQQSVASGR